MNTIWYARNSVLQVLHTLFQQRTEYKPDVSVIFQLRLTKLLSLELAVFTYHAYIYVVYTHTHTHTDTYVRLSLSLKYLQFIKMYTASL